MAKVDFDCIAFKQGTYEMVFFIAEAKKLWDFVRINTRIDDKKEGYQRALSNSRVRRIATYISSGNPIPLSILVSFDYAQLSSNKRRISVDSKKPGWVIDGQHRLAGAFESSTKIMIPVVAFLKLSEENQIQQFVTVNKEAKGVPTSLYLDLLPHLKNKKPSDMAKERVADIASGLKLDEDSPFFGRIVVVSAPKKGELSLTNFVRKIMPMILEGKGLLGAYTIMEQKAVLNNYYMGLKNVFPSYFKKYESIFFQTLGFGALMNAFPVVFSICLREYKGFRVEDITKVLNQISHFDFEAWSKIGTGTGAENDAAEELISELRDAFNNQDGSKSSIRV
jgi:DGQHR domain-containing protein